MQIQNHIFALAIHRFVESEFDNLVGMANLELLVLVYSALEVQQGGAYIVGAVPSSESLYYCLGGLMRALTSRSQLLSLMVWVSENLDMTLRIGEGLLRGSLLILLITIAH